MSQSESPEGEIVGHAAAVAREGAMGDSAHAGEVDCSTTIHHAAALVAREGAIQHRKGTKAIHHAAAGAAIELAAIDGIAREGAVSNGQRATVGVYTAAEATGAVCVAEKFRVIAREGAVSNGQRALGVPHAAAAAGGIGGEGAVGDREESAKAVVYAATMVAGVIAPDKAVYYSERAVVRHPAARPAASILGEGAVQDGSSAVEGVGYPTARAPTIDAPTINGIAREGAVGHDERTMVHYAAAAHGRVARDGTVLHRECPAQVRHPAAVTTPAG